MWRLICCPVSLLSNEWEEIRCLVTRLGLTCSSAGHSERGALLLSCRIIT